MTCAAGTAIASQAAAAPSWVERGITLPRGDWAFDVGLGVGHARRDPNPEDTVPGMNAEMSVGVTDRVEIGLRGGVRFGDASDRSIRADQYGRLFDRQTLVGGADALANPELRVRGAPVRTREIEVAFEGRISLPFETGTDAGLLFGLPLAFHLGHQVRLDTGAYVPVAFRHPADEALSLPLDLWIQASSRFWLGPMTGLVVEHLTQDGSQGDISVGFGMGYEITQYLDFKAMVLLPTINHDGRLFGVGAGVEIRIE